MKYDLGRCRLLEKLEDADLHMEELLRMLGYKRERIQDYIENKRVMPLKTAINIADALGCSVQELYELLPIPMPSTTVQPDLSR